MGLSIFLVHLYCKIMHGGMFCGNYGYVKGYAFLPAIYAFPGLHFRNSIQQDTLPLRFSHGEIIYENLIYSLFYPYFLI